MKIITLTLFLSAGIAGAYAQTNNSTLPGITPPATTPSPSSGYSPSVSPNGNGSTLTPNNTGTNNTGIPNSGTTTPNNSLPNSGNPSYTPDPNSNQNTLPNNGSSPTNTNPVTPLQTTP